MQRLKKVDVAADSRVGGASPCSGGAPRAATPDGLPEQQQCGGDLELQKAAAEPAAFAISILTCPAPPAAYLQQQQQQQAAAGVYALVQTPVHMLQQLQVPSQQGSARSNPLREEVGEIGSKGALESFSPTFATELLADIELEGDDESPAAAAGGGPAAAAAAAAAGPLFGIEVPIQQKETGAERPALCQ
ncbi:hypothetical protein Efla_003521 [Eimeria flavescens]